MQQTTNSDLSRHYLPRQLRHLILQEYLSGVKTARQLSEEHGIPMSTIHKMGQRWKAKNSCSFVSTPTAEGPGGHQRSGEGCEGTAH